MLDVKVRQGTGNAFWNCNYWSSFVNENERFLIGGIGPLEFITIRDVARCVNYQTAINILNIFGNMLKGYGYFGAAPSYKDVKRLSHLIAITTSPSDKAKRQSSSTYVYQLFIHFLQKQENVLINWSDWKVHKFKY